MKRAQFHSTAPKFLPLSGGLFIGSFFRLQLQPAIEMDHDPENPDEKEVGQDDGDETDEEPDGLEHEAGGEDLPDHQMTTESSCGQHRRQKANDLKRFGLIFFTGSIAV